MNRSQAAAALRQWDQKGRYVFRKRDLAKLFPADSPKTFAKGLKRMVDSGVLMRASSGIYVNPNARSFNPHLVVEDIATALRAGEYNYASLESQLSEYGAISQIPIDRITVMTTGRRGIYRTPYGVIEFTHTARPVADIISQIKRIDGRPLRIASKAAAWRDLKRVGRNVAMVDEEMVSAIDE